MRKMGRSQTREALSSSNLDREIARQSGATKVARTTVQRRQQRAFNVQNGRNPRIGSKALYVYQSQLKELGSTSNKRVPFRRKPMTETQAKKAASARNAADQKRLLKAINADTESRMTRAPKPAAAAPKPAATAKSRAAKPAAAAARTAAPKPAASKSTARPLSQRETQNLGLAKSNLAISKERLAFAREAKAKAKGPLEKLKATDRINEHQTNIRELNKKITAINARPAPGRPITGADRSGNRKQLSAPKKSGAIKGSIKRDASASSKLKNKSGLNAGKFKNIYMANANKAAAAKRKRNP